MFIREYVTRSKKTNTAYVTHRLVESVQTEKGPRQRIIMHLGTLTLPKSQWRHLAKILEARLAGRICTFEETFPALGAVADRAFDHYRFVQAGRAEHASRQAGREIARVDLQSMGTGYSRSLGPELVAAAFWDRLGFDEILAGGGFTPRQTSLAKAVIVQRLVAPADTTRRWLRERTAVGEMLPEDLANAEEEAFGEVADDLYVRKNLLERELRSRVVRLFAPAGALFLYDLTGAGSARCRETADCCLVTLALAVDELGFPVFSRIYGGKRPAPRDLAGILHELGQEAGSGGRRPTIVMDRGMAAPANLDLLKSREYPYIVVERQEAGRDHIADLASIRETCERLDPAHSGPGAVYVKKIPLPDGCSVIYYSEDDGPDPPGAGARQEKCFREAAGRLQQSVARGSIVLAEKVAGRVQRLQQRYPAAFRLYDLVAHIDHTGKRVQSLTVVRKAAGERGGPAGCLIVETSHRDRAAGEIWRCCTILARVAEAFRSIGTDLGMRPVCRPAAERTEADLFVSVLAYHLLVGIEHSLRLQGDQRRWSAVREQLSTHRRSTVMFTDAEDRIHRVRVSGMPEREHREIYRLLAVEDPLEATHRLAGSRQ